MCVQTILTSGGGSVHILLLSQSVIVTRDRPIIGLIFQILPA